jgi:hypothetical protein
MKSIITFIFLFISIQLFACCNKSSEITGSPNNVSTTDITKLKISIGINTFIATLYNNSTVIAFKSRLPLTIDMNELNGNEKYFDLPNNLPANASNVGTVQAGDLMLYGANTLVLFYKTFSTSYHYTPMGRIDNASGFAAALGSGNKTVKFELQ